MTIDNLNVQAYKNFYDIIDTLLIIMKLKKYKK